LMQYPSSSVMVSFSMPSSLPYRIFIQVIIY